MIYIGIDNGVLVVLRKQNYAIVVLVDDNSTTLKRYNTDRKNKKIVLLAENKNYPPIVRYEVCIMGVLFYLLKDIQGI